MIGRAWSIVWRDPVLLALLLLALVVPAYLGALPIDQALVPLLDLAPSARGLDAAPLDDGFVFDTVARVPSLEGTLVGGVAVALLVAGLAVWLVEAAIAAAALGSRATLRWICGRSLGLSLLALPLRILPGVIAWWLLHGSRAPTWGPLRDALIVSALLYAVASAKLTVLVDLARGHAIADDEHGLWHALLDGARTAWRNLGAFVRLVALELASFAVLLGALALTRPLGLFHGAMWIAGLLALGVRVLAVAIGVAASARLATGAAARSA